MSVLNIIVIILVLGMLLLGICTTIEGIKEKELFIAGIGIFVILLVIAPTTYAIYDSYQKNHSVVETKLINATVAEKTYQAAYTTMILSGKVLVPVYHAEQWNIQLKYNDVINVIDNKALYEAVKDGEKIEAQLVTYKLRNGSIYKREINIKGF